MPTHAERKRYRKYRRIAKRRQENTLSLEEWQKRYTRAPKSESYVTPPADEGVKESLDDNMESSKPKGKNGKGSRTTSKRPRYGRTK